MTQENSYQNQTGQVAPTAQNPQSGSLQPYQQQTSEKLQTSTEQLLEGQSNVSLVLPNGSSTVAPSGTTQVKVVSNSIDQGWSIYFWPGLVLFMSVVLFVLLVRTILKTQSVSEEPVEEYKKIEVTEQDTQTNSESKPKPKKKPNKQKKRKGKK